MTGHVCPECGVHRPGCACARAAETARAEDFDPLRIRPYVTLDAPEGQYGAGADLQYGAGAGVAGPGPDGQPTAHMPAYGAGAGPDGQPTAHTPTYATGPGPDGQQTTHLPAYATEDPPTAQLAAIRPGDLTAPADLTAPIPVAHEAYAGGAGPEAYAGGAGSETYPISPGAEPYPTGHGSEPYPDPVHPGTSGDPSETMPLLLRGVGDVPPGHGREQARARRRRRGVMVAAVTAVAVAGTAALAAAVLGGADGTDDRAAVPEVTTSASLNVAVSEAPSPSSETPEPTTSSPTPERTSASPSPTSSPSTTASPSASTSQAAPPAAVPSETPTTAAPTTATPSAQPTEETAVTLSMGSRGDDVVELQMRLTLAGAYHGDIDGKYDQDVWRAVKNYQSWMYIEGDPKGVYGPNTREALERSTSLT
ncbi:peptidoglycan-binding protein [Streptomyces sp. NPDC056194]|uniref:peptidoglycan-binding protein n=1 Tax=unclassified Streptomyces TaxID=2593676 RepID=UPI0035D9B0C6